MTDSAMKKTLAMQFTVANEPIKTPKTKFGGQPVWVSEPQWPLDENGKPLHFVCQIALDTTLFPDAQGQMAYLFMSNEEDAETWDPEFSDNAVIIQPGTFREELKVENISEGPTLLDNEYDVELRLKQEPYNVTPDLLDEESYKEYVKDLSINKIGGTPLFIQGDEYPKGFERLLMQLNSTDVPFHINFGDSGTGYVFINATATQAKFLWQCY